MSSISYMFNKKRQANPKPPKPVKNLSYLSFVRELPCLVRGTHRDIEAAHLSEPNPKYGHLGRGKGQKASDRWALPLCSDEHRTQHSQNEMEYWRQTGINPYEVATAMYSAWKDHSPEDARVICLGIIYRHREEVLKARKEEG